MNVGLAKYVIPAASTLHCSLVERFVGLHHRDTCSSDAADGGNGGKISVWYAVTGRAATLPGHATTGAAVSPHVVTVVPANELQGEKVNMMRRRYRLRAFDLTASSLSMLEPSSWYGIPVLDALVACVCDLRRPCYSMQPRLRVWPPR